MKNQPQKPTEACICCGFPFDERKHKRHRDLNTKELSDVCNWCWKQDKLYFLDKKMKPNMTIPPSSTTMLRERHFSKESIEISVLKIRQKGITGYIGKIRAADIVALFDLKRWSEENIEGYQRKLGKENQIEIAEYLANCPIPIIPAILVSLSIDVTFKSVNNNDLGELSIPLHKGALSVIDGQHRMSGFQYHHDKLSKLEVKRRLDGESESIKNEIRNLKNILDCEVPVVFLDSKNALESVFKSEINKKQTKKLQPVDIERIVFYVLNKTQRGISPSLKDTLQYLIFRSGITGIPAVEKELWRIDATEIGHRLNSSDSPFTGLINLSGGSIKGKVIRLNTFVSSLEPFFHSYKDISIDERYNFVKLYWSIIKNMFPLSFKKPSKSVIFTALGIYTMNWLASDIYRWGTKEGLPITKQIIEKYLLPLADFDWDRKTSSFRAFGGVAGVTEAHLQILNILAEKGINEARQKNEHKDNTVSINKKISDYQNKK